MGQEPLGRIRKEEELPSRPVRDQDRSNRLRDRLKTSGWNVRLGQDQHRKAPEIRRERQREE